MEIIRLNHKMNPTRELSYNWILFLLATMNSLHLWVADVGNTFLNGIARGKLYIIAGPVFGPERAGKPLILYKSIYGACASCAGVEPI